MGFGFLSINHGFEGSWSPPRPPFLLFSVIFIDNRAFDTPNCAFIAMSPDFMLLLPLVKYRFITSICRRIQIWHKITTSTR